MQFGSLEGRPTHGLLELLARVGQAWVGLVSSECVRVVEVMLTIGVQYSDL